MNKTIKIRDLAKYVRSKNAKAFLLTFDIIFPDRESYFLVKKSKVITKKLIAKLYSIRKDDVRVLVYFDQGNAIKITIKRPLTSGDFGDPDVLGAQQHAPLYDIKIPA